MEESVKAQIKNLVNITIENKLKKYASESEYKPFFEAIFSKETIVIASIIQSFYTTFGMSIYEKIAEILAKNAGYKVRRQYDLPGIIDEQTETLITNICGNTNTNPDKKNEIEQIRESIKSVNSQLVQDIDKRVDIFIVKPGNKELYVDITTVKSNLKEFRALRKKMLRWCALRFSQEPEANIRTCIGIPYNPYHPNKYERWTANVCDSKEDILVQEDLWREFAGYNVFPELIELFEEIGDSLRDKVSNFLDSY